MFSAVRKRVTYANVALTLTLVFAMTGGAYAAKHYLITSTKQISPKVLKQLRGKAGPQGAQGPAGSAGLAGPKGDKGDTGVQGVEGKEGKAGAAGKGVVAAAESPGANCAEGGASFEVEGSGVRHYACNGFAGAGTLPSGKTETGLFEGNTPAQGAPTPPHYTSITFVVSFPVPLAAQLPEGRVIKVEPGATGPSECESGTLTDPKAAPGYLCLYLHAANGQTEGGEGVAEVLRPLNIEATSENFFGVGKRGVEMRTGPVEEQAQLDGVWAVTAP